MLDMELCGPVRCTTNRDCVALGGDETYKRIKGNNGGEDLHVDSDDSVS